MNLYRYAWRNNDKRATLYGRLCRVIARGAMNSALVEFYDTGQREIVSRNALRRVRVFDDTKLKVLPTPSPDTSACSA